MVQKMPKMAHVSSALPKPVFVDKQRNLVV